ncbi:hypothetical protein MASR2M69_23940 [Bacteroidota bacterium]
MTQSWHLLHFVLSIVGLKRDSLERRPRSEPTGHIVLQYSLPLNALNIITVKANSSAKRNAPVAKCA